ncbi:mannosyltransferase [Mucor velutinosus]|uniref:Mannosyltransferase n=1 Tax=Mucor velutinosus TaxID=708070 RepID=A0AAN7D3B9_9FUNG|nr:mannosyltransferase [Mucor velutinosus]
MSSLTSVGVNKNKKGFAPKLSKRKDRKERKPTTASTSAKAATDDPLTTEAAAPSLDEPASTLTSKTTDNDAIAPPPSTVETQIAVKVQSTSVFVEEIASPIDPKSEYLTAEEIAINAAVSSRKRRRVSKEEPDNMSPSSQSHSIKEPSPVREASPSETTNKPDCTFDKLLLKIESVSSDSKETLGQVDEEPQQLHQKDNVEEHVRVRKESVAPKVDNNVPKMDVNDDIDYTDLLASGEDGDVDVDGDVPVERLMPVYIDIGQTDPNATPMNGGESSTRPATKRTSARSSKLAANNRLKGTRYTSGAEDDDDQYEEEAEEPEQPKKKKKIKPLKPKGKGKEKEKSIVKGKSKTGSKGSKKATGTAISIGIGIPSASTAAPITPAETAETSAEEEEYSEEDSNGNRVVKTRKKKRRGHKKSHRFDYRLVENMRTLDDITNDPAPAANLEMPMFSFTKDIDGIVSKVFKEMEVLRSESRKKDEERSKMSKEELEALKLKEAAEERIAREKRDAAKAKEEERRRKELDGQVLAESSNALQVRLVNGEIVLDTDSLVVERTEGQVNYGDDPMEVVEENSMTRKVNSMTYGKRKQSNRWDEFETALFYDCLSQFGTDFEMIANMMPGRTRNQIRMKFNREERLCPEKVTEYMISKRKPMDLEKYKEMAGIELEAVPDDFHEMQLA